MTQFGYRQQFSEPCDVTAWGKRSQRLAVLLGLVARQRHQPGFGLRRDDRFFARPWSILDGRQRPIGQRPFHVALNRLVVDPNSLPYRDSRDRPAASAPRDTRLAASVLDRERAVNLSISSSVIVNSITRRHPAMIPLLVLPIAKQGIRHQIIRSMSWFHGNHRLVCRMCCSDRLNPPRKAVVKAVC